MPAIRRRMVEPRYETCPRQVCPRQDTSPTHENRPSQEIPPGDETPPRQTAPRQTARGQTAPTRRDRPSSHRAIVAGRHARRRSRRCVGLRRRLRRDWKRGGARSVGAAACSTNSTLTTNAPTPPRPLRATVAHHGGDGASSA